MAVVSTSTTASGETSSDKMKPSPASEAKTTEVSTETSKEEAGSSIQSPTAVSKSTQEQTPTGKDENANKENTWNGDSWSQEDVSFHLVRLQVFDFTNRHVFFSHNENLFVISNLLQQDKKLKSVVSARKKALRKRKQGRGTNNAELDINWQGIGSTMDRDGGKCKERYTFLRQSQGGKGPVPWTRDEDKQILALVAQHGKNRISMVPKWHFLKYQSIVNTILFPFVRYTFIRCQKMELHREQHRREKRKAVQRAMAQSLESKHQQIEDMDSRGRSNHHRKSHAFWKSLG